MPEAEYLPLPPPAVPDDFKHPTLSESEETKRKEVLAHFTPDTYALPETEEGKGQLTEDEKFWLVRLTYTSISELACL